MRAWEHVHFHCGWCHCGIFLDGYDVIDRYYFCMRQASGWVLTGKAIKDRREQVTLATKFGFVMVSAAHVCVPL